MKKRHKNKLPVLTSDQDLLEAFEKRDNPSKNTEIKNTEIKQNNIESDDFLENEDFATMLEESFKAKKNKTIKGSGSYIKDSDIKNSKPISLKKRLKRYPDVELELDLHGYDVIGAQIKFRSFIQSCRHQGYYTLKIIVGRGIHSENGAVLPDVIEDELKEMKKQNVIIFYEWDRKKKIKSGAIIVYLKQFE